MKIISQTYVHKHWHGVFDYVLTQWDNNIQKDDFNSFVPATINTFSCANPTRVAQSRIAKDIRGLSGQSERAFNAIRCLSILLNDTCAQNTQFPNQL